MQRLMISPLLALEELAQPELPSVPRAVHAVPPTSHSTADAEPGSAQLLLGPLRQTFEWTMAHSVHHCHPPYMSHHLLNYTRQH